MGEYCEAAKKIRIVSLSSFLSLFSSFITTKFYSPNNPKRLYNPITLHKPESHFQFPPNVIIAG